MDESLVLAKPNLRALQGARERSFRRSIGILKERCRDDSGGVYRDNDGSQDLGFRSPCQTDMEPHVTVYGLIGHLVAYCWDFS